MSTFVPGVAWTVPRLSRAVFTVVPVSVSVRRAATCRMPGPFTIVLVRTSVSVSCVKSGVMPSVTLLRFTVPSPARPPGLALE